MKYLIKLTITLIYLSITHLGLSQDTDKDEINDSNDNCPLNWNYLQRDDDNDGVGDICDQKYIITSVDENAPVGHLHDLSTYLPNDATNLSILNGNEEGYFSVSELSIKIEKKLSFNQNNKYVFEVSFQSSQVDKPSYVILYINYVLNTTRVSAVQTSSNYIHDGFDKYVIYDPYLDVIDEDKRLSMATEHRTFTSFYGSGPNELMALDYDFDGDGLKDLVFGLAVANYDGYILQTGHMSAGFVYMTNLGGFNFEARGNSFENNSVGHGQQNADTFVDLDGDSIPEMISFGEHYHIEEYIPYLDMVHKWKKSKGLVLNEDFDEFDFKKIGYFKISENNELIDVSNKINDSEGCFYSMYQTGYGDIDNDGDIDFVFGAQLGFGNNNTCSLVHGGRHLGILRNDGNGNFEVEWPSQEFGYGNFDSSSGYLLLEDISGDGYLDLIYNNGGMSGVNDGNNDQYNKFMLNDGSGNFIYTFDNNIDVSIEGMRNIFVDDLDNDSKKEIIIFSTNGYGSGGSTTLKNFMKVYNHDEELNFTEVTDKFFSNNEEVMDFYSQETWMKYIDLDYDGYKDLVPKFSLEAPSESGTNYPGNAYTKDWNDSKGFQYFKFNSNTKKFEVKDLGIIDKIEQGNSNCQKSDNIYNFFDFVDLDGDSIYEWLTWARPGPYKTGNPECMKASFIIYKPIDYDSDKVPDIFDNDVDNDSIFNDIDLCPFTPHGEPVDENGCSISQKDSDGDGVKDDKDLCPDTPSGVQVDDKGCPLPLFIENMTFIEKVYPNPTKDIVRINFNRLLNIKDIYFVDLSGKKTSPVSVKKIKEGIEVDINNLRKGVYLLEISTDSEVNKIKILVDN